MPDVFQCDSCNLSFTVGGFYYNAFGTGYGSEALLVCLQCGTQGTAQIALRYRGPKHYLLYDVSVASVPQESRVAFMKFLRSREELSLQASRDLLDALPLRLEKDVQQESVDELVATLSAIGVSAQVSESGKEDNPIFGPLLKDRLKMAAGPEDAEEESDRETWRSVPLRGELLEPSGEFDLSLQKCRHCDAIGDFASALPEGYDKCPRCSKSTLRVSLSWIT